MARLPHQIPSPGLKIGDEAVDLPDNQPENGQVLTYSGTTGQMHWNYVEGTGGGGGTDVEILDENISVKNPTNFIDFTGTGVTVLASGTGVRVEVDPDTDTHVEVRNESAVQDSDPAFIDFAGNGVVATASGGGVRVEVTDTNTDTHVEVRNENAVQDSNPVFIDFAGPGVTATASGTGVRVEVNATGGGGAVAVEDEGSQITAAASTLNFVGDGVTVTDAGGGEVDITISAVAGGAGGPGPDYLIAALSAEQTTNLNVNDHLEFDSAASRGTSVSLATGAGQANGLFTLEGGKTYEITAAIRAECNEGNATIGWTNDAGDVALVDDTGVSTDGLWFRDNAAHDNVVFCTQTIIYTPVSNVTIKLMVTTDLNLVGILPGSRVVIQEIVGAVSTLNAGGAYLTKTMGSSQGGVVTDTVLNFDTVTEQQGDLQSSGNTWTNLKAGRTYLLIGRARTTTATTWNIRWYDVTNSTYIGESSGGPQYHTPNVHHIFTPSVDTVVDLRVSYVGTSSTWDGVASVASVIEIGATASTGTLEILDEGTTVSGSVNHIDFVGAGVTVTPTVSGVQVTVSGGGGGGAVAVEDEGSQITAAASTLNFVGAGVFVADAGAGEVTVTISGGGSTEVPAPLQHIETIEVGSDTSSVTFSNLNGDTDETYIIEYYVVEGAVNLPFMQIQPNGSTTNTYSTRATIDTGTNQHDNFWGFAQIGTSLAEGGTIEIHAKSGQDRRYTTLGILTDTENAVGQFYRGHAGTWYDTSTNITSLVLATSDAGNGLGAGSYFKLYKRSSSATIAVTAANLEVKDDGATVSGTVSCIDFAGEGVVATASGNCVRVQIDATGGGGGAVAVEDEGSQVVASASTFDFVGPDVVVTDAGGGEVTVTVSGGPAIDLATTGASVNVSAASPPSAGQVLKATGATTATWQAEDGGVIASAQGDFLYATLASNITPNIAAQQVWAFDTIERSRGSLTLEAGGGISGLKAGRTYLIFSNAGGIGASSNLQCELWDATGAARIGQQNLSYSPDESGATHGQPRLFGVFVPSVDSEVQVRVVAFTSATIDLQALASHFAVVEIGAVQANVIGGLEFMDTITVASDQTSVSFGASGDGAFQRPLDGDVDEEYHLTWQFAPVTATTVWDCRPNGITSNIFGARHYGGSTQNSAVTTDFRMGTGANGFDGVGGQATLIAKSGLSRYWIEKNMQYQGGSRWDINNSAIWTDTTTKITSLDIVADTASQIKAGTVIKLWRKTSNNVRADSASTYERNAEPVVSQGTNSEVEYTLGHAAYGGSAIALVASLNDTVTAGSIDVNLKVAGSTVLTATLDTTNTTFKRVIASPGIHGVSAEDEFIVGVATTSLTTTGGSDAGLTVNATFVNSGLVQPAIPKGMDSNLWYHPETAHADDDEFESGTLGSSWAWTTAPVSSPIDPYSTDSSGGPRVSAHNQRRSWLMVQPASASESLHKSYTPPTNVFVWARLSFNMRLDTSPVNNDANCSLRLTADSAGSPSSNDYVAIFINETDTGVAQVNVLVTEGGSTVVNVTTPDLFGSQYSPQVYEYVGIHKLGSVYHFWAATPNGSWTHITSHTYAGAALARVLLQFGTASTASPGNMILGADFIRFVESATFLP